MMSSTMDIDLQAAAAAATPHQQAMLTTPPGVPVPPTTPTLEQIMGMFLQQSQHIGQILQNMATTRNSESSHTLANVRLDERSFGRLI